MKKPIAITAAVLVAIGAGIAGVIIHNKYRKKNR